MHHVGYNQNGLPVKRLTAVVGLVLAVLFSFIFLDDVVGLLGYYYVSVRSDEVGVKFDQNQPVEILGPGVYSDMGLQNIFRFKGITTIKVNAISFEVSDPEVLTKDKQRMGVVIQGVVRRPGITNPEVLLSSWPIYRQFYQDDASLLGRTETIGKEVRNIPGLMDNLGDQAAKVCIGDRDFDKAVIGSARDELKECITKELGDLAAGYGLTVANIVVPNFILSKEVQSQLDAITQARLATQLAAQRESQNMAEARQNAAKEAGAILVEQGKVQEKARQDAMTASLQESAAKAQQAVIEAEKSNALLTANRDKEIAAALRDKAAIDAQATYAPKLAEAKMYQDNPGFAAYMINKDNAAAWNEVDKVIVPAGTNPIIQFGNSGGGVIVDSSTRQQPAR